MTKLIEWLAVISALFCIWAAVVTNKIETNLTPQYETLILISPILLVGLFGLYAATVVLYRTFTFNNCEEASIELQKEIKVARTELSKLGFVFVENKR